MAQLMVKRTSLVHAPRTQLIAQMGRAIDTRLSHVEFQQSSTLLSRLQKQRTKFKKNKEMGLWS